MKSRAKLAMIVGVLVIVSVMVFVISTPGRASSQDDIIMDTLVTLGVEDAQYMGIYNLEFSDKQYLQYVSESSGIEYLFDAESKRLISVRNQAAVDSKPNQGNTGALVVPNDDTREKIVLDFVKKCFGTFQIGNFQIDKEYFSNVDYKYIIKEYYSGVPTGSSARVVCGIDGQIMSCTLAYGAIFENTGDQIAEMVNTVSMITSDTAIQTAKGYLAEIAPENGHQYVGELVRCELNAREDLMFYEVELNAMDDDWEVFYIIWVDIFTGNVLHYVRT